MKTKNLSLILLAVCTISFIGCERNEIKTDYHLKLSRNSVEMMQGRKTSLLLAAHENTTLDIALPEVADAVFEWGSQQDGYTAVIEIKGKQKGETDIVVTDHKTGESATITVKVTELPRLAVKQAKGNIFSLMNFYLSANNSKSVLSELSEVCDSIVWTVKGEAGSHRVFQHDNNSTRFVKEWGHCFTLPGNYETYLSVWKNNKIISLDKLDITITNDNDFLEFNWKDITKPTQAWTVYADVLGSNPKLITTYDLNGTVPSIEVRILGGDISQNYTTLHSYFSKLYSQPTYEDSKEKQKIFQLYEELFSEQKKYPYDHPCAIWVTEHTHFALLLIEDFSGADEDYIVYAEPRKR